MFSLIRRRPARTERALTRRGLFDPFESLRGDMDNLLERFMEGWRSPNEWIEPREWRFEETDKEVIMRMDLPGFEAKEIDLRRESNELLIRVEHPEVREEKEAGTRSVERFESRMTVPFGTDVEHIEATYRNGVLELHFPRLPEAQPRRIEVKA